MSIIPPIARIGALLLGACAALGMPARTGAQTRISNTATLTYGVGGAPRTLASNTVTLDLPAAKRPTSLSFRLLPLGYQLTGLACDPAARVFTPARIDATTLAQAPVLETLDVKTPLIMVLDAQGENRDPTRLESTEIQIAVGSRTEKFTLFETAPDSGVFAAGVPAGGTFPELSACDLTLERGAPLTLSFIETEYSTGSSKAELVDPAGYVFDSRTGELVEGATVTLLDAAGQPARVFGDDGVSIYPSTVVTGIAVRDASGRLYPEEDGRYRFPFVAAGTYHLRIVPPAGYTAPSIVDRATLAQLRGPSGMAFVLNEASFGGTLTLISEAFFADIPIDRAAAGAELLLTKTASVREASPGDFIQYRVQVTNRGTGPATAIGVADSLPPGLRYERGSTRGAAEPVVAADGRTLTFGVPTLAAGASTELRYLVTVAPGAPIGETVNRVHATGPGVSSNEAVAAVRVRALLFTDALTIIGRVTEGRCGDPADHRKGVAGVRLLMEDGSFAVTDRDGLYHFEGVRAGRHVVQIDTNDLPITHQPIACDIDTRQAGSAISRFVEGTGGALKRVDFQLAPTGKVAARTTILPVVAADDAAAAGSRDWIAGQAPGIGWLFPDMGHNPRAPALRVAIQHGPTQHVALTVNGQPTDPINFDTVDTDQAHGVAVSRWSGLPLVPGDNRLVARVLTADGGTVQMLERVVHLAGAGVRARFDAAHSRLVADGATTPLVAVRITDRDGRPVRAGTIVPFRVDQPYGAQVEAELEQSRQLAGRERNVVSTRVIGDDGLALIGLQPTTQAGAVHLVVSLADDRQVRTSEIRAWLSASARDWVVVGFGAGTIGHDLLASHAAPLARSTRDRVVTDGQLALYAKGRVKGSWLLTLAYDSDRAYDPRRGLLGTIDPDRYYTVYGDGTQQGYDAASRRKLYLRLERRQFYALWGDFETGFTETQLTRYSRTINGAKAAYEGERVRASAFAAHVDTLYGRDEIQGNGLSGPYRLSGRDLVPNSDKLRIEVRDRFRSERIVSSRQLTRHIDYDIDASAGTIRFREPVLSRDADQNPVFIVADYEVEGGRIGRLAAAARVAVRLVDGVDVGGAVIRDETIGRASVGGIDARARIGSATELRAELATGGRGGLGAGRAGLIEAEHHGRALDLLGYVRQQDARFGVGQQNVVEAGTRKIGLDGRWQLTDRLSVTGTAWHQDQLDDPGDRTAVDLRLEYRRTTGTLFVGAQVADDTGRDGIGRQSRLLTLGGTQGLFGGRLELTGQTQIAPGGRNGSVDFPIRHQLTAAWRLRPSVRLIGGYEIANGEDYVAHTARIGFDLAPWSGAKLMSTLNQQAIGENGARTFAQYGLSQSLPIGKRLTVDATLDASSTISGRIPTGAVINAFQPVASGGFLGQDQTNGSFTAATLGATWRADRWSLNGRLEYRDSTANERVGLTASLLRSLGEGKTLASGIRAFRLRDRTGAIASSLSADLAVALRPLDSRWSLLERLELRHEGADAGFDDRNPLGVPAYGGGDQMTTRLVNNLALNYRTGAEGSGHGLEASIYYGAKYVRGRFAADIYDGFIDVTGFELRQDLGPRLDVGVQGSVQHAWGRGAVAFSGGPSIGVSPAGAVWITAGWNVAGYRDPDFAADRYTRQGPYLTMRLKFDQRSLGRIMGTGR